MISNDKAFDNQTNPQKVNPLANITKRTQTLDRLLLHAILVLQLLVFAHIFCLHEVW